MDEKGYEYGTDAQRVVSNGYGQTETARKGSIGVGEAGELYGEADAESELMDSSEQGGQQTDEYIQSMVTFLVV